MTGLPALFSSMARNNRWSNHVLLRACEKLDGAAFTATRTSFFPSIAETLAHNYFVDLYYIDALEEDGRGESVFDGEIAFGHAAELMPLQQAADERLIAFCDRLADGDTERTVVTDRGAKGQFPERIDHLLAHLFQHQIHHRGQAHAMLAGTSVKPPQLDEFFLDFERDPEIKAMGLA